MSCEALLGTITQRQIIWMKLSWMFQRQLFLSPTMNEVHNSRLTMSCLIVKYSFIQFIGFWLLVLITVFERIKKQTNLCKKIVVYPKTYSHISCQAISVFSAEHLIEEFTCSFLLSKTFFRDIISLLNVYSLLPKWHTITFLCVWCRH